MQWREAYDKHGTGSTFVRARIIGDEIYEPAAPILWTSLLRPIAISSYVK